MPSTNGTIDSSNQTGLQTVDDYSNAHRQYASTVTLDEKPRPLHKNSRAYIDSVNR